MLNLLFMATPKLFAAIKIWLNYIFLENLQIKWNAPKMNCGIKATKGPVLFS